MRYYVLGPTGERYGPADVPTLNTWIAEGRLFPNSRVMEEMSGTVAAASTVSGLAFAQTNAPPPPSAYGPMQPPPPNTYQANYPRPGSGFMPRAGAGGNSSDLPMSFGMALLSPILSLFCIFGFTAAVYGIGAGWRAYQNGQKIAIVAVVLNGCALVFWVLSRFIFRWWLFGGRTY